MLKCLWSRGVMGFLPPPGGPMAHTNEISTNLRNDPIAFLSYHPPWSIHCLTSSMGGWAPYTSKAGMLRSSMKRMNFLPRGGPNIPLRLKWPDKIKSKANMKTEQITRVMRWKHYWYTVYSIHVPTPNLWTSNKEHLLSNFESMMSCVWLADVWAEKAMKWER